MNDLEIITSTFETGGFWAPSNPDGWNVTQADLPNLRINDEVCRNALRARSLSQVTDYALPAFQAHGKPPEFDGKVGPAMEAMLSAPRCYVPDHAPPKGTEFQFDDPSLQEVCERMRDDELPAIGTGNWPRCHGVGNFHSASVRINLSGIGSHLKPVFDDVLKRVQTAYAKIGLLFHFILDGKDIFTGERWEGRYNLEFSFVQRSNGWIGLAIVGQGQTCSSNIWCRYLATYRPADVISEWVTLINHELGHNCGMGHFPGRNNKMNPGIIRGLPNDWVPADSSYNWLVRRFGGKPVNVDVDDPPPTGIEARLDKIEKLLVRLDERQDDSAVKDAIQDAAIQWLISRA